MRGSYKYYQLKRDPSLSDSDRNVILGVQRFITTFKFLSERKKPFKTAKRQKNFSMTQWALDEALEEMQKTLSAKDYDRAICSLNRVLNKQLS